MSQSVEVKKLGRSVKVLIKSNQIKWDQHILNITYEVVFQKFSQLSMIVFGNWIIF